MLDMFYDTLKGKIVYTSVVGQKTQRRRMLNSLLILMIYQQRRRIALKYETHQNEKLIFQIEPVQLHIQNW